MGVISNAQVSVSQQGSNGIATITWDTDVPADSTVNYGQGAPGSPVQGTVRDGNFVSSHSITLFNLATGAEYFAIISGTDERGTPLSCDIVSPGANCTVSFKTPAASGPATALSVSANPENIAKGQQSQILIHASAGSTGASGRTVNFDIHNGNDRGTFSPNPATTGSDGSVVVAFTALKNGKAQIQVLVDTLSDGVDVMVN